MFLRVMTQTYPSIPIELEDPRIEPQESSVGLCNNSGSWHDLPSPSAAN